jgi:SynChlorMet cassette protein ScmC
LCLTRIKINQTLVNDQAFINPNPAVSLSLIDGTTWHILAGNEGARFIVARFAEVMQLQPTTGTSIEIQESGNLTFVPNSEHRLLVMVDGDRSGSFEWPSEADGTIKCQVEDTHAGPELVLQLLRLSLVISSYTLRTGGLLIHGALAQRDGYGVILSGPGGVGKSTASRRLPPPWRSLCDDSSLVVRGDQGEYWAHPWPTWSDFLWGGSGGKWDVQRAVQLNSIFFLEQAAENQVAKIDVPQSICQLIESAQQVSFSIPNLFNIEKDELRAMRLRQLDSACLLAQAVPSFRLQLNQSDAFWNVIEQVLNFEHT